MTTFPDHPFWDYSLKVYGSDGVAPACLHLQERHGVDVNMLLFCCWFAASGRGALKKDHVEALNREVADWHGEIVRSLRGVRRRLKEPVGREDRTIALALRQRVQKLEIDAEHIEQLMLAKAAEDWPAPEAGHGTGKAVRANVAAYFEAMGATLDADDQAAIATLVAAAGNARAADST